MLKFKVQKHQNILPIIEVVVAGENQRSFYDNCDANIIGHQDSMLKQKNAQNYCHPKSNNNDSKMILNSRDSSNVAENNISASGTTTESGMGSYTPSLTPASSLSAVSFLSLGSGEVSDPNENKFLYRSNEPVLKNQHQKNHRTIVSLNENVEFRDFDPKISTPFDPSIHTRYDSLTLQPKFNEAAEPIINILMVNEIDCSKKCRANTSGNSFRQIFTEKLSNFETQKPQRKTGKPTARASISATNNNSDGNILKSRNNSAPIETISSTLEKRRNNKKNSLALPSHHQHYTTETHRLSVLSNLNLNHRSSSLGSLSSLDSGESNGDAGFLKVYTGAVRAEYDYVTLKISGEISARAVIAQLLRKFRLSARDSNLFQLLMEVRTRAYNGVETTSVLELDNETHPLELQRCHPPELSRFVLAMVSNAVLVRIFDSNICPESNYKSILISRRTTCSETLRMVLQMCRLIPSRAEDVISDAENFMPSILDGPTADPNKEFYLNEYGLFIEIAEGGTEFGLEIPLDCALAEVHLRLMPRQRITARRKEKEKSQH